MPCKTKASPEEMLDQIASYLYQGVTITQAAENLHMSRITFRKWVLRYKEEAFKIFLYGLDLHLIGVVRQMLPGPQSLSLIHI